MFVQSNPILGRFCFAMVWGGSMCQYWVRERTWYNNWVNFASNDWGKAHIWVMGSLSFAMIWACNAYLLWSHGHASQQSVRSPFFNEGSDVYIGILNDASILPTPEIHIQMPQKLVISSSPSCIYIRKCSNMEFFMVFSLEVYCWSCVCMSILVIALQVSTYSMTSKEKIVYLGIILQKHVTSSRWTIGCCAIWLSILQCQHFFCQWMPT